MVHGMKTLSIDLETRSGADISKCGVYRYAEDPDFDILLFGVSVDGAEPLVYDVAGGELPPEEILDALNDCSMIPLCRKYSACGCRQQRAVSKNTRPWARPARGCSRCSGC